MATTYLSDTFVGVDGTNLTAHTMNVGSGWTKYTASGIGGDITIQSNKAQQSASGSATIYTANAGHADCVMSADVTEISPGPFALMALIGRFQDTDNHWRIYYDRQDGFLIITEVTAGVATNRALVALIGLTSFSMTATFSGNTITATIGATSCNYTSAVLNTKTLFGLYGNNGCVFTWDNFLVTDGVTSTPTSAPSSFFGTKINRILIPGGSQGLIG